jgi:linearmycin/streptolysin S transport system ATP-binding protein
MGSEERVQCVDLARAFGSFEAVRGISLEIHAGETFGLLGPNGAGKTTTLSMLSTLLEPTRGDVVVFGASVVRQPAEVRRRVGLAPQQISLYPTFTAQENLDFFGVLHGVPSDVRRRRADELLELVGLATRRDDQVHTYSGGMQRRLNLACSMIHHPRLLLLDEPTAGVDPQSRENLFEVIRRIASSGTTIVYTTHYMEEAERLCDRIAILDEGRIAAVGTQQELLGIIGMGQVIQLRGRGMGGLAAALQARPGVVKVESDRDALRIFVRTAADARALIAGPIAAAGDDVDALETQRASLEQVFMHLTGKALRD